MAIVIGAIIGDIVGSRFEFNNHRNKEFALFTDASFVTDDSIMTLAVGKALLETEKEVKIKNEDYYRLLEANTIKHMQAIGRQYPDCGYGGRFSTWMFDDDPKPYNSYGNGAAMRVSPVAWVAQNEDEVKRLSFAVTKVTHNHPEGIKGAEAVALAIFLSKEGHHKRDIRTRIEQDYYTLDFMIDEIRDTYDFNETCQDTVPQALQAFFESKSFEDAIRTAISVGGDSDTIAAITGSIAEAYYGVFRHFEEDALSYLDDYLRKHYDEWMKAIGHGGKKNPYHVVTKYIPLFKKRLHDAIHSVYDLPREYHDFFLELTSISDSNVSSAHHETLNKLGIQWRQHDLENLDVQRLDEDDLIYIMRRLYSTERIHDGAMIHFIREGYYATWLQRLEEIATQKMYGGKR